MKNIIKSQLYQLIRDKFVIYPLILFPLLMLVMRIPFVSNIPEVYETGGCFFANYADFSSVFAPLFILIVTPQICGTDFLDKTNNYELMSGHSRGEVFFGRAILTVLISSIGAVIIMALPVIVETIINGWGTKVGIGDAVLRFVLLFLVFARLSCEFILITSFLKNPYAAMIIGWFSFMVYICYFYKYHSFALAMVNMNILTTVDVWVTYGLGDTTNYIYDASLDGYTIFMTVAASLVIGAGSLIIGYAFFKKDDLN